MSWLSVREAAELRGVSISAIRKAVKQNKYGQQGIGFRYINGIGRGGKVLQIALESLPEETQARYHGQQPQPEDIMQYTLEQRNDAETKAWIVEYYQGSGLSPDAYVKDHNDGHPECQITRHQLMRWQKKYMDGGKNVAALIDNRGGHNKEISGIHPDVWQYFYNLYMTLQKPSIQRCWEFTRNKFGDIPHVSSFERKVSRIPIRAILRYREGKEAFKNSLPFMERDYTTIQSNDLWFSDEHVLDIFTKNNVGKALRYYLTVWFDARSRKVLSYMLRDIPADTGVVKESLRMGMEGYGIPFELYVDNGMAYKSKDGLSMDFPLSLVRRLGINTIHATPRHGQAKTVERFFGTLEDRFGKLFPTYAGRDAKLRPEPLRQTKSKTDKYLQLYAPSEDVFLEAFDAYITEYNGTPHRGHGMDGASPNEVYSRELKVKQVISDTEALRLLCGRSETRTVQRNGIYIKDRAYWHDDLAAHYKESVTVIYDPGNIDEMNVFDESGKAICVATPKIRTAFRATTDADYREAKRKQKFIRKQMEEYRPAREMSTYELIALQQRDERQYAQTGGIPTIEKITPMMAESKKLSRMKSEPEIAELDDTARQLQRDMMKYLAQGG